MRFHELTETIAPPDGIAKIYYHGTSKKAAAQSIMKNGISAQCQISLGRTKTGHMIPVAGMVWRGHGHDMPENRLDGNRYDYRVCARQLDLQPNPPDTGPACSELRRQLLNKPSPAGFDCIPPEDD